VAVVGRQKEQRESTIVLESADCIPPLAS